MKNHIKILLLLFTISLSIQSCAVIGGIFKAGVGVGIAICVLVVVVIAIIIAKVAGKK